MLTMLGLATLHWGPRMWGDEVKGCDRRSHGQ